MASIQKDERLKYRLPLHKSHKNADYQILFVRTYVRTVVQFFLCQNKCDPMNRTDIAFNSRIIETWKSALFVIRKPEGYTEIVLELGRNF